MENPSLTSAQKIFVLLKTLIKSQTKLWHIWVFLVIVFYFYSLKMTGLDVEKDQIIEMACIITDSDLNIIAEVIQTISASVCDDFRLSWKWSSFVVAC